jgi:anthranilate 1,2-dioxygenase (deaminating, decarboxylating) large subunit
VLALLLTPSAWAYLEPSVNLGFTSFMDGGPPAGPGFYFQEYVSYYTANKLADLPVPNPEVDVWVSLNQFIYQSNRPVLLGGKWGLNVIVPLVSIESQPSAILTNEDGLGDITVGPFLQWDPIMGKNGPIFMHRVELQTIWPTGSYDQTRALNAGSNFFSFDPYWSGTLFITPKWTASLRVHYLWNAENNDTDARAGQAVHANFAASYEAIAKKLRVGVNGYFLEQVTHSEVANVEVADDEGVFAIGPGVLWSFSQNSHLFFNAYFETEAKYRPEGERFVLRFVHHF